MWVKKLKVFLDAEQRCCNMPQYGLACCSDDRTWSHSHSVMSRGRRHTQRDNGHDWPSLVTTILSPPAGIQPRTWAAQGFGTSREGSCPTSRHQAGVIMLYLDI